MSRQIEFQFEGADAPAAAEALAAFLQSDFADWTTRIEERGAPEENVRSIELALGVVGVILALPSAVTASLDLVERRKLKKKADALIEWGQDRARHGKEVPKVVLANGRVLPLDKALPEHIINAMSARW